MLRHTHTHIHLHAASPLKQPVTPNSTVGPDGGLDGTDRAQQQSGRYGLLKIEQAAACVRSLSLEACVRVRKAWTLIEC